MSAHHRKTTAPRLGHRSRSVLGGAAMTAVFLGGGTGVAMAGPVTDAVDGATGPLSDGGVVKLDLLSKKDTTTATQKQTASSTQSNSLGDVDIKGDGNEITQTNNTNIYQNASQGDGAHRNGDWGGEHKDREHGDKAGSEHGHHHATKDCPEEKAKKDCDKHGHEHATKDCPEKADQTEADQTEADQTEADPTKADEDQAEDTSAEVEQDNTADIEQVAADTAPESNDQVSAVPSGSADTGDGSTSRVAPVASTSSGWGDDLAAGGGIAASALLAAYGVQMNRRRRVGTHRS